MKSHDEAMISPHHKPVSSSRAQWEQRISGALSARMERLSFEGCRRLGAQLGLAFFAVGKRRRELAIANVQMALRCNRAQATRIARRSAQNWGMTTCEFLHMPGASPQEIRDYVSLDKLEYLQSLQGGNGVILLTAHLGNWEALSARLAQEVALSAIMRPLSNSTAQERMSGVRSAMGMELISKHAAARPSIKALRAGGSLLVLPDRHAGPEGALLPLLGRETRFETAPARFAVMSGAPIVPVWGVRREPWLSNGRIEGRIMPGFSVHANDRNEREAAVIDGTRLVIAALETTVRAHPDQWSWMLRRWRDDDAAPAQEAE
ncbi:MAG: Kdo2-lipid lauroyltransferase/acyltransferase [Abditibacteriota bacterium]|nr:Kdo2-lipid lauroyltransferase/acyltransferase [Abditibacteriota bacterium]